MSPAGALRAAMALIEDEARWCQGALARTARGRRCRVDSPTAARWCAMGAVTKCTPHCEDARRRAWEMLRYSTQALYRRWPAVVNDELGHAAVLACYREAIRRMGENGESAR